MHRCCAGYNRMMTGFAPGAAHLMLADNVVHLDPAPAMVAAMLEGWRRQQSARFLRAATIGPRIQLIERLMRFSGLYPWQWTAEEGEAFIDSLRSKARPIKVSTARSPRTTCRSARHATLP